MKVFLTRPLHDFIIKEMKRKYTVEVYSGSIPIPREILEEKMADVSGLVCFPGDTIDAGIIDSAKNLKTISTYSVGFDHIDIEYAKRKGISIGYTPDVLTDATADLAFALILDVTRRITEGDKIIRNGRWNQIYGARDYVGVDIRSKTLGILGLGRIGKALAKRARAFGMNITYHNRNRIPRDMETVLDVRYVNLDELISCSDIISIHVPHTKETDGMFDANMFGRMKNTAVLINTARGRIINQKDLTDALSSRRIYGAGMDVFESEPIKKDDPLTRMENAVLTPHIGSSTEKTREEMARITLKNLEMGMTDQTLAYSV